MSSEDDEDQWTASRLTSASYKDLGPPEHVSSRFLNFLLSSERCLSSILNVARSGPSKSLSMHFSIEINVFELMQYDNVLGTMLLRYPFTLLLLLEEAIVKAQGIVIDKCALIETNNNNNNNNNDILTTATVKGEKNTPTKIHARLVHLPPHINCCKPSLSCIDAGDVGNIVQLSGTVVRASPVRMVEKSRAYVCRAKNCGHKFVVYADFEQWNNALNAPTNCPNLATITAGKPCKGTAFEILPGDSEHTDYQEIKIQESATKLGSGTIPHSILVKMEHDLVDCCKPGDDIVIVGTLSTQWQPTAASLMCDINIALHAHSVRVVNSEEHSTWEEIQSGNTRDKLRREFNEFWSRPLSKSRPLAARNYLVRSVCPKLYGLMTIKLALLLTLIGGVSGVHLEPLQHQYNCEADEGNNNSSIAPSNQFVLRTGDSSESKRTTGDDTASQHTGVVEPTSAKRREQCHLLLVGDPGCGKSVFLRWASALSPRSVLTTGVGTTSAGLTCAAVRDGKDFVLEAGALVLADRGVCCIDEFGCIRNDDRTTIHEAMEQQTLSVAKGGIVCTLSCRTTIIAACNPKGGLFNMCDSLSKNTGVGLPLLSRFDLIFTLIDSSDMDRDSKIAAHLLNSAIQGSSSFLHSMDSKINNDEEVWNMEKLRAYIATIKSRFKPRISAPAAQLLQAHYQSCRMNQNSTVQVTVRLFEALIRLSQAHARLMFRNTVTLQDAVSVILLMECSAWSVGGSNPTFAHNETLNRDPMGDFPDDLDCDAVFLQEQLALLSRYDLLELLPPERKQLEEMNSPHPITHKRQKKTAD